MKRFAAFLVAALVIPLGSARAREANDGTYKVAECDPLNRADADAILRDTEAYSVKDYCGDPTGAYSLQIASRAPSVVDHRGLVRFETPTPALGIVGVKLDAKLRGDGGNHPRLWLADGSFNEVSHITGADSPGDGFHQYTWSTSGPGARQFIASLTCEAPDGCPRSNVAKAQIRNVRLTVADYADPQLQALSGSLMAGGWIRGTVNLDAASTDVGSGLRGLVASVNRQSIGSRAVDCEEVPDSSFAVTLVPCLGSLDWNASADTAVAPFRDGSNQVEVCAVDFAANSSCSQANVMVDNTAPELVFANSQDPSNPELVVVSTSDAGSGVGSGSVSYRRLGASVWTPLETVVKPDRLEAHVDSTSVSPGDYEFMATATDVAGNSAETSRRADGQPMVLSFPLKEGIHLNAHLVPGGERRQTVGYGRTSKVAGRLVNSSGKPLDHARVRVVEHFSPGALIRRRIRVLRTDRGGFFGERIPAGPSRKITASYGGSRRYLGDAARAGRLVVRSKASLRTSRERVREGRAVVFKGIVRHRGARIPPGGKLVELQVRDGKYWNTVRQAFYTRPNGRYRLRYRFRADYTRNAKFHFRVKIVREQQWPYRAPVRTRSRKVVVLAR